MWDWEYALSILPRLLGALPVALYATGLGFLLACVLGLLLAILGRIRYKALRLFVNGCAEFIRATPLLVQLFFIYYAMPFVESAFLTGVIGLGVHYSTFMSEVYRSGIDGVDKGQWEAARALNFTKRQTWGTIILPQAIPPVLPIMGNYLLVIFKETPLLAAITVVEMLTVAKNITSNDWRAFEPYTLVGILFLAICLLASFLISLLEKRVNRRYLS